MEALGKLDKGLSSYGLLINNEDLFSELSFSHIRRDGNRLAHSLTRLVITMSKYTV